MDRTVLVRHVDVDGRKLCTLGMRNIDRVPELDGGESKGENRTCDLGRKNCERPLELGRCLSWFSDQLVALGALLTVPKQPLMTFV
jgi:hypothetical protein